MPLLAERYQHPRPEVTSFSRGRTLCALCAGALCFLSRAELIVAHNAAFDVGILNTEFALRRLPPVGVPTACTMLEYRARQQSDASIDDIVAKLGLKRQAIPNALEEAWLTMQTFLWLRGCPYRLDFSVVRDPGPANFRARTARVSRTEANRQLTGSRTAESPLAIPTRMTM